jgi:hypothetical protein
MPEPFTLRIFVPSGDPDGVRIVDRMNWTGRGYAVPRDRWGEAKGRPELTRDRDGWAYNKGKSGHSGEGHALFQSGTLRLAIQPKDQLNMRGGTYEPYGPPHSKPCYYCLAVSREHRTQGIISHASANRWPRLRQRRRKTISRLFGKRHHRAQQRNSPRCRSF